MSEQKITKALLLESGEVLIEQEDGSYRLAEDRTDWERIRNMTEAEIEAAAEADEDAPPAAEDYWTDASVVRLPRKQSITAKFDEDVVAWFKAQGRGYQTRMNAVLRAYMQANRTALKGRP